MSILKQTEPEKLISMLRAEIGEIIQSWIDLKIYTAKAIELQTDNLQDDIYNQHLILINLVRSKFRDDLVSRLSELSSSGYGKLNFHFASNKLGIYEDEIKAFRKYLVDKHFVFKRNKNISHKQMSPTWDQIDPEPHIPYIALVKAIGWAVLIMKNFDKAYLGEKYILVWREERKQRYELTFSGRAKYLLLPYAANIKE
jgi:hypothetical protein